VSIFSAARLRTLAALLIAAWLVSGCNAAMRIAYENADTFLHWRALSYVPLSGKAADELDDRIDNFLAWHRAKALPQYARLSADAARRVKAGLSPADLVWGYDSFNAQARESLREAAVQLAPMLDRLTPEQLSHLEKRLADDNRKFARDNRGSEKDRRNRRTRRMVDSLEDWVGKLSKAQVERVKQYAERAPMMEDLRERDRKRLQGDVLAIIRAREAQKRLPAFVDSWDRGREPAMVLANKAWRGELDKLLLDIDRTLTAEQRAKAVARLHGFSEDFSALAVAVAAPVPASVLAPVPASVLTPGPDYLRQ
jgi:uncharacterized protein YhaN